jgi:ABC-type amino acid transport substrate-binding protein
MRQQNILLLLIVITLTMYSFAPDLSADQGKRDNISVKAEPDRISVAYCIDCVPFHFQNDQGQPSGMIIEFWQLWSQKTGIAVDFRAAPWDDTLTMVGSGKVDAHAGLFFNKKRDKFLDYGVALRKTDTHTFIHNTVPPISRLENLLAYRIGVLAGDYVEGFLKKRLPGAAIIPYSNYADIMTALKEGSIRVFAADTPTGIFHLQGNDLVEQFSFSKELLLYQNDWFVATKEGNATLLNIINKGMSKVSLAEKLKIGQQWTGVSKGENIVALERRVHFKPIQETKAEKINFDLSQIAMGITFLLLVLVGVVLTLKRYFKPSQENVLPDD